MAESKLDSRDVDATATTERQTTPELLPALKHGGRRVLLGGIALFLAIIAAVAWFQWPVDPLPPADQIATMHVQLRQQTKGRGPLAEFEVPSRHFSHIRSALSPTRLDRRPANCEGMGGMRISTRDGREFGVSLYSSDFEIGRTSYLYPNGTYKEVEDAILAAHADALRSKP